MSTFCSGVFTGVLLMTWDARPLMILGGVVSAVGFIGAVSSQSLYYLAVWFTISSEYWNQHCLSHGACYNGELKLYVPSLVWVIRPWNNGHLKFTAIAKSKSIQQSKLSLGLQPRRWKPPYVCKENLKYDRPAILYLIRSLVSDITSDIG